jgi:hypothetical protein
MKRILLSIITALLALGFNQLGATTYTDATGDLNANPPNSGDNLAGFTHLDIVGAEIVNSASDIYFTISVAQNPITSPNDWGNYMIGIDSKPGGSTTSDAWARPITMSSGMDYWLGSWVNGGGGSQVWSWNGASWDGPASSGVTILNNTVTFSTSLASLGLNAGDTFTFDIYSSGGGGTDSAVDALANPATSITTWGQAYDSGSLVYSYTVVPEPATLALAGLSGLLIIQRFVRRRA